MWTRSLSLISLPITVSKSQGLLKCAKLHLSSHKPAVRIRFPLIATRLTTHRSCELYYKAAHPNNSHQYKKSTRWISCWEHLFLAIRSGRIKAVSRRLRSWAKSKCRRLDRITRPTTRWREHLIWSSSQPRKPPQIMSITRETSSLKRRVYAARCELKLNY